MPNGSNTYYSGETESQVCLLIKRDGPEPQAGLCPIDDELRTEEYEELHEIFEALGASTKHVGLLHGRPGERRPRHPWGDAHLEPDRTFTWPYREQLPVAPVPLE